jgi:hypothetical protein
MVMVDGTAARADAFAVLARRAVEQVRRVLPSWRGGLVVEVPGSEAALDAALGARPGDYQGIAAVTTTVDGSRSRRSPSHVFVNARIFDPLRPTGAQVVITHEATHVATDAATSRAPLWLVEGFADYVAYRTNTVPTRIAARDLTSSVRRGPLPTTLPTDSQFDPAASNLGASYELAWLACRFIAVRTSEAKLLQFYKAVGAAREPEDDAVRHAFDTVLGSTPESFATSWHSYVVAVVS